MRLMRPHSLRRHIFALSLAVHLNLTPASPQSFRTTGARPLVSSPTIEYPRIAKDMNLKGVVKLLVTVAADGHVVRSEVMGGSPVFVPLVVDAMAKSKWQPRPQETKETVEVTFQPAKP